eukprot:1157289-Pelagomonas_calceolata.AAC.3
MSCARRCVCNYRPLPAKHMCSLHALHAHLAYLTCLPDTFCPLFCRHWEGIYVLYTYAARRQTARAIQLMLSNPEVGSENVLLRHMTMCKY